MQLRQRISGTWACLLVILTVCSSGCGRTTVIPPTVKDVEISITKDGKPLGHVEVGLIPIHGSERDAVWGQADGSGQVVLPVPKIQEYQVQVSRMAAGGADPAFNAYAADSPLRADLTTGTSSFTFDLN